MEDYIIGKGLFDEEENKLLMCSTFKDPMSFEKAIKSPELREALDLEIKTITKNE